MDFQFEGLLVLLHVLFATLWVGGAVYQVRIIGPALMQAGPAASGFLATLARRGGIGKYFAATGGLTILFGGWLYGQEQVHEHAFEAPGLWITLGAIVAVLAYAHGAAVNLPTEKRWLKLSNSLKGPPTAEQGAELQRLGMQMGKNGAVSMVMIAVALLLMLMSRVLV